MKPLSVLVIDDEELDRYLLGRDLQRAGIEARLFEATDGEQGLDFMRRFDEGLEQYGDDYPPVLIFLDINMPRMDGFTFLERYAELRETEERIRSCVVMMFSSTERPDEVERALSYDFVRGFITKGQPSKDELRAMIEQARA